MYESSIWCRAFNHGNEHQWTKWRARGLAILTSYTHFYHLGSLSFLRGWACVRVVFVYGLRNNHVRHFVKEWSVSACLHLEQISDTPPPLLLCPVFSCVFVLVRIFQSGSHGRDNAGR